MTDTPSARERIIAGYAARDPEAARRAELAATIRRAWETAGTRERLPFISR